MGTTAEKGAYLTETKSKLKDKINKLGGQITNQTTFRNYVNELDNVYDRLPKTSYQEGTNINLGKTLKAVVQYEDDKVLYGDTSQETRQYIDVGEWEQGGIDGTTGNNNGSTSVVRTGSFIPVTPNVLYNITRTIATSYMTFRFYDINKGYLGNQTTSGMITTNVPENRMGNNMGSMTMTINNSSVAYMRMTDNSNDLSTQYTISTTNTPSPNYPQNINVVTGTQEIIVPNNNLAKAPTYINYNVNSDGFGVSNNYAVSNKLYVGNNTQFYYGLLEAFENVVDKVLRIGFFKEDGTFISRVLKADITETQINSITIPANTTYIMVGCSNAIANGLWREIDKVCWGFSTDIKVAHTETTYQVHLGNLELAKIGTYQDYIYFDVDEGKWYKKGLVGKKTFNGTENWNFTTTNNKSICYISIADKIAKKAGLIANSFIYAGTTGFWQSMDNYKMAEEMNTTIFIRDDDMASKDAWKTWLRTHNLLVYYVLATETDEEITDTTLIADLDNLLAMMSIEGTTIIEVSGNLPATIKVRAVKG